MKKNMILLGAMSWMAALLLCTACSSDDVTTNTVPAAPEGKVIHYSAMVGEGDVTRATLNDSKKYEFQTGDKLAITGTDISGELTLTGGAGTPNATFEGDLNYTGSGTPDNELTLNAVLVSTSSAMTTLTYDDATYPMTAIASTLAEAVEKYSYFTATSTYGAKSFTASQQTSFLNFTVTFEDGTATDTGLAIDIQNGGSTVRTGSVTTAEVDGKVVAQFVAAMLKGTTMSNAIVQLGTKGAIPFGGTTTLVANKIYNIKKTVIPESAINGVFTINASGDKVYFSKGNLQAKTVNYGSTWTWKFANNQWDYIGDAAGNTSVNGTGTVSDKNVTVDLFGWVGASSTLRGAALYGINNSTQPYTTDGYGNNGYENLKSDWGTRIGGGWRTLTGEEWTYIFNTRASGSTVNGTRNARYTHATIRTNASSGGVIGMILFPDGITVARNEVSSWGAVNSNTDYGTKCTIAQWTALAAKGAVFLPASGYRRGATVRFASSCGFYWSSSPFPPGDDAACGPYFGSNELDPASNISRYDGSAVRLVHKAE